ncbi:MAG: GTPase HflX [Pseudomonadota bacterium]
MFFERPELGRRAVLVTLRCSTHNALPTAPDPEETRDLAIGAGLEVCACVEQTRAEPHPRLFLGAGKVDELKSVMAAHDANLLLLNHDVGPGQQRNLEQALDARVMPRTELILHIFADRAASHEGKLQVELAQLRHAQTRLVRGWTHLDRQKGGIGMRGAGETQIEMDQRMLAERVKATSARLATVERQRASRRRRRERQDVPLIALVGYTNAGKSTLFNRLTEANVLAEDRLFATLDPTSRQLDLPGVGPVVLSDTVGFISQLPHSLVDAFKSTLEDVARAELLLHVIDVSAAEPEEQIQAVDQVLEEIDAQDVPQLRVLNKFDQLESKTVPRALLGTGRAVAISARDGTGVEELLDTLGLALRGPVTQLVVSLPPSAGRLRARLYEQGLVDAEATAADGTIRLLASLDDAQRDRLATEPGVVIQRAALSEPERALTAPLGAIGS